MPIRDCKQCKFHFLGADWEFICPSCMRRSRQAYEQAKQEQARRDSGRSYQPPPFHASGTIPADMLKRMIMLCHPDKHGNSEMSKTVTQWLLTQRK